MNGAGAAAEKSAKTEKDVVIRVRGLTTRFGETTIFENLDLDVYRGEVLGVVGGSGTGKSVLLRTIIGLNRQVAGTVEFPGATQREIRHKTGVLFQNGALFTSLTVAQNIQAPMRENLHLSQELMDELAAYKLNIVGLPPDTASKYPSELSGGMRKRAGLARALALDPEILFLDEPTAGLDPIGASAFDDLIKELRQALGLTVFMVTHDLDSLHAICDRIAVLAEKRILVVGTMQDMLKQTHPWIVEYFHGPRARAALAAQNDNAGQHGNDSRNDTSGPGPASGEGG